MSDSSITIFNNPTLVDPNLKGTLDFSGSKPDWKKVSPLIEQDELISVNSLSSFAFGVTSAKNKITAELVNEGTNPFKVKAYQLT